ncbi:MAG: SIMPL domain-containing protein [Actinomycetia bacterium]|nr:SIMPL domain-containing protein [Actinomycetes bacterium]
MTPVRITVRGTRTVTARPEQATVRAMLTGEGPSAEPVFQAVASGLAEVRRRLEDRHHPERGPVIRFAVDQIRLGSYRPPHPDRAQLPPVYTAAVPITATFTDFDELAVWVGWCAQVDGLGITGIDWALTAANRRKIERKTRRQAVREARRRAQDYADALDLGTVAVSSISDTGPGGAARRTMLMARASAAPADGPAEFALRPDDIEIAAEVEAVFTVHSGD